MTTAMKICGACGAQDFAAFADENFTIAPGHQVQSLSGHRCTTCGEVYFDADSQARYAQAGNAWVLAKRQADQQLLLRVRKKLKLTQQQAAKLTGGGHNAFSRYERGEVQPMPAVVNLFKLLDKHPELLAEVV